MADKMTLAAAKEFAQQAQRGMLSALGSILRSLAEGKVHDSPVCGTGISAGVGTICKTKVHRDGDVIKTSILVDLTGLTSAAAADIIGVNDAANCWIARIFTAINGTILGGKVSCLEAPITGEPDVDLYSAVEGTGTENAAITGLDETALLATGLDWTIDLYRSLTAVPADGEYLYLVASGGGDAADYTGGKFLIELFGYDA